MCQHDTFRRARGAGSETHKRRVRDVRRERRPGIFEARKSQTIGAGILQRDRFAGIRRADAFIENRAQRRLRDHVVQFIQLHLVMNRHDHRAAAERRQRADDERAAVARPHADTLAGFHAELIELRA